MVITLTDLILFTTTAPGPAWADTDGRVELRFEHNSQPRQVSLDTPWDDRERGRTDRHNIDIGGPTDSYPYPQGIRYDTWEQLKAEKSFHIQMLSRDAWRLQSCFVLGNLTVTYTPAGDIDPSVDRLGWYLLDRITDPQTLSADPSEGNARLQFDFHRGAFPTPLYP